MASEEKGEGEEAGGMAFTEGGWRKVCRNRDLWGEMKRKR